MAKTLSDLLAEADALFSKPQRGASTFNYSLGRFPEGWSFDVTNSWYAWADAGYEHHFRLYRRPEEAVMAFLNYVNAHKINVAELMHD